MFDHVTIRVADRAASEAFYRTVLGALGRPEPVTEPDFAEWDDFSLASASAARPATRGLHLGFSAPSREAVDAFWRAGIDAGHPDDGAPGPRPEYSPGYYGGFLRDPGGLSAEAVNHDEVREDGVVDHLWIRVADLAAARAFYLTIAPYAGLRIGRDTAERVSFVADGPGRGTFSLLPGEPTSGLHLAFAAPDDATVAAFHAAAVGAGYRDDGAPGERPEYHPGYVGAYVLDPDGTSVEVVCHHRG